MSSTYYKVENKHRYRREVLEMAKHFADENDGTLTIKDAHALWAKVQDAGKVTQTEQDTLSHICDLYQVDDDARKLLLHQGGYYQTRNGVKMDCGLVQLIESFAEVPEGQVIDHRARIGEKQAHMVWKDALDGKVVTSHELDTLIYHLDKFDMDSRKFMIEKIYLEMRKH